MESIEMSGNEGKGTRDLVKDAIIEVLSITDGRIQKLDLSRRVNSTLRLQGYERNGVSKQTFHKAILDLIEEGRIERIEKNRRRIFYTLKDSPLNSFFADVCMARRNGFNEKLKECKRLLDLAREKDSSSKYPKLKSAALMTGEERISKELINEAISEISSVAAEAILQGTRSPGIRDELFKQAANFMVAVLKATDDLLIKENVLIERLSLRDREDQQHR